MSTLTALSIETHRQRFAEQILPVVERHARVWFRNMRCRKDDFADAIADCLAHAWQGYIFALNRGKEPWLFPSMIATFAARKTKVGRKIGKRENAKDVFNAARAGRIALSHLEDEEEWQEAVKDNSETPPPDQAAFRIDFPAWLQTLTTRNRKIAKTLAVGHSAKDVAKRFDLSQGRITQLRQQMLDQWEVFTA